MEALNPLNPTKSKSCTSIYGLNDTLLILEHYNYTGRLTHRQQKHAGVSMATGIFLFISICIILENLLVLLAMVFRIRLSSRWVYICIANITLSDLLAGVAYVVNLCMSGSKTFDLSPAMWFLREGVLFVTLAASIFSLLLIAVERYTTMMKPLHQKSTRKMCRIYTLVVLCWFMAFIIGFLPMVGWNCICNLSLCSTLLPLYSKTYILFTLILFFIILLAIGVIYGAIYVHVIRSAGIGSTRGRKRSLRLLKTVMFIVGAFLLCWGPLFSLLLLDFFCYSRECRPLFSPDWVIALAVLNSAMNPIIYSLGSLELRRAIASLLCCCCLIVGLLDEKTFRSKETSSTSGSRHDSLRNSFNKARSMNISPPPAPKTRKSRLSSTTSCLSVSSD
ncbi:sphingosine 1-phosphate receptor 4 [Denticeps clupeoides]|uniref:G-protein coupled receptors family 1 profile domain-containing protein n=1 Tax=Denticeps clupeoides TaxID=299321 RepID=A0AAY4DEN2_9TELE|nr:sphingosine 1-phosphate receptor 4 [Denticeps clupeoides]